MSTESFELVHLLPAAPERVYAAWLDGGEHGKFTGGKARVDPRVGGAFRAWDDYIEGKNLLLEPHRRIVQSWRSTDFPTGAADSKLELVFEPAPSGTRLILRHSNLPEGQGDSFRQGWMDHYFAPMTRYFKALSRPGPVDQARAALGQAGEQAQAVLDAAGQHAGRAIAAVKKTAKKAAKQVRNLAKKAKKSLARAAPAKKAKAKPKLAKKKPAKAKRSRSRG